MNVAKESLLPGPASPPMMLASHCPNSSFQATRLDLMAQAIWYRG